MSIQKRVISPSGAGDTASSTGAGDTASQVGAGDTAPLTEAALENRVESLDSSEEGQRRVMHFQRRTVVSPPQQPNIASAMEGAIEAHQERMEIVRWERMDSMTPQEKMERMERFGKTKMGKILRACLLAKYLRNDNVPCELQPGLYLGSIGAAFNKGLLQNLNVTHILSVASAVDMPFPHDFKYLRIDVLDGADVDLARHFDICFSFIDEARLAGGGVLVHCFAGRSRSVTVVVAYLMKTYGMRLVEALAHVTSMRKEAQPNPGFMVQLQNYDHLLEEARRADRSRALSFAQ